MKETSKSVLDARVGREGLSEKVTLNCDFRGEKDPDTQLCRVVGLDVGCGCRGEGGLKGNFFIPGLSHLVDSDAIHREGKTEGSWFG